MHQYSFAKKQAHSNQSPLVPFYKDKKMKDKDKTREQLTEELEELRRRNAELEAIEAKHLAVEKALKQTEQEKQSMQKS